MISDNTLETVLNLWKKDKITLEEAKKLLNIEGEGIKWRQPQDLQPPIIIPWIQPVDNIPRWNNPPFTFTTSSEDALGGKITTVTYSD